MSQPATISTDLTLSEDVAAMQQALERLSWAARRLLARQLEGFDLTTPQYMTLRAIHRLGAGCSMSTLAQAAHQVSATMTGIVDRLAERGLVQRQPNPSDRRSHHVLLTGAGERLLLQIEASQLERLERIFGKLSPEERQAMLRLMQLYLESILSELEHE